MKQIIKLLLILFSIFTISACSSIESGLTSMFETINDTDPLPKDYGEKANEEYGTSQSYRESRERMNNSSSLNPGMTFEDWHNNQYRN